jgi:uncharacterized repeat protein (TIGR01451 family)
MARFSVVARGVLWPAVLGIAACGGGGGGDFNPLQPGNADAAADAPVDATGDAAGIDAGSGDAGPGDAPLDAMVDAAPDAADLSIAISDAPDPVAANATLSYTIDVTNHGALDAANLVVTQRLPAGNIAFQSATGIGWTCSSSGQLVTCTRTTLLVGAAPSIVVKVTTPSTGGPITTSVTVAADTPDSDLTNNDASATTTVLTPADLAIAITDGPDPVAAGGALGYTITVSNSGPGAATNVSVLDSLPSGVAFVSASGTGWSCSANGQDVTCLDAALAVSGSSTITLAVTAPTSGGTVSNTASVSAMTPDSNASNNAATTSTTVNAAADLSVAVSDSPDPVLSSGTLQYLVDVTNAGPNTASGITVTDTLPAGNVAFLTASGSGWSCSLAGQVVSCTRPSLVTGAAPTITIAVQAPSEAASLMDSATVTSTSSDLNTANNSASASTTVLSAADLSVSVIDSPDPVTTGGALSYTVTASNAGPSQATNVTVTSTLPSGVAFVDAGGVGWTCSAIGQQVTCTTAAMPLGAAQPITIDTTAPTSDGSITETSSISTSTTDPGANNNSASQSTTVNAPSDLSLALSASPTAAAAASTLTYTIGITDLGPRDATNLVVTDRLPDGNVQFVSATGIGWTCALAGQIVTCTRPLLIVGAAPSIAIQITTPPVNGGLVDQASVTASTADLDTSNNAASVATNVFDSADLSITASETPAPVRIGTSFSYTLSVANDGPTPATAVEVDDTLPDGATFVSASGAGWTCSSTGQAVTCMRPSLAIASSAPAITIVATAPATAGTMTNAATASSATSDPDATNNTVSTGTLANLFADLSVAISDTPDPVQGTPFQGCSNNDCTTYTISTTNAGPDFATGLKVVITLPNNGTFFNCVGPGWVCPAPSNGTITCTRGGTLGLTSPPDITLVWKAPSPGGFSILVSPTVSGTSTDPNTANNTAVEDTTVQP